MSDKGARRGAGAPFYAPPRRKTSAEIISEARAAIYGEMSGATSGAGGGALRPLRTRRPFTPREPQRTLFTERARKRDTRPPSAFDLKYLSLSESGEDLIAAAGARIASLEDDTFNGILLTEPQNNARKKPVIRNLSRSVQEKSGDSWSGFTKLPHLSGRSKPLHRRNTTGHDESKTESELALAISISRPLGNDSFSDSTNNVHGVENRAGKSSPEASVRRRYYATTACKSSSCESGDGALGDIPIKHLAVQLPNTSPADCHNLSVLELAEALSQRSRDVERTVQLLNALYTAVECNTPANSLRELVLRALYTHVDSDNERVLVTIARTMLTMRVTGNHLAAACKLVFKIARNDKNDHFFRNTNLLELLVEGCGRADPLSEGECCVYGAGALRFLALEPRLCALAHRAGALHLAALHLKILNNAKAENPRAVSEQSTHALYQLTGALRNLAGSGGSSGREARAFVASGALGELLVALTHHTDRDVLTNVARCLSVLSAEETCCAWLCASPTSVRALLRALAACAARGPLTVRLAYTLGNMAAADERARINIYNEEGGVDVLLTILESYTKRGDDAREPDSDPDLHLVGSDLGGSDGSNEDVLIKTVCVVANLCLCERAGRGLAEAAHASRAVRALLACLQLAEKPVENALADTNVDGVENGGSGLVSVSPAVERRDELATAVLATLNNITFYREPPAPPDPLDETLDQLCKATCRWLRGGGACAREAVRALGNLSRAPRAARLLVLEGALDALAPYLQHVDPSVRCAAAGVLVNVCGAGAGAGEAGAAAAAHALSAAAAGGDAAAGALLARALWNAHAHAPLEPAHAQQASAALAVFIDDESVFAACEASRGNERRASDPEVIKHHVKFNLANNNYIEEEDKECYNLKTKPLFVKAYSVDQELHLEHGVDEDRVSGEDLGFEEGDLLGEDGCECAPCRRLAAWEELVGVAIPLLENLRPTRADASVGTD